MKKQTIKQFTHEYCASISNAVSSRNIKNGQIYILIHILVDKGIHKMH